MSHTRIGKLVETPSKGMGNNWGETGFKFIWEFYLEQDFQLGCLTLGEIFQIWPQMTPRNDPR